MADQPAGSPAPDEARVVAHGEWEYALTTRMPVNIIQTSFEFWYELAKADDRLERDETPTLNNGGCAFYVSFHGVRSDGTFWPDSTPYESVALAKAVAESRLPSPVAWERR